MAISFRHSAGFGKRMEYWVIGRMLKEGLDVYVPLVDDNAVDAVIRRLDGSYAEIQIKARSLDCLPGDCALFAAIVHEPRENYFFVFYSERLDTTWIMSSEEFILESNQNKNGRNVGKRSIWFNGRKKDRQTGDVKHFPKDRFSRYQTNSFRRLIETDNEAGSILGIASVNGSGALQNST